MVQINAWSAREPFLKANRDSPAKCMNKIPKAECLALPLRDAVPKSQIKVIGFRNGHRRSMAWKVYEKGDNRCGCRRAFVGCVNAGIRTEAAVFWHGETP